MEAAIAVSCSFSTAKLWPYASQAGLNIILYCLVAFSSLCNVYFSNNNMKKILVRKTMSMLCSYLEHT